MRKGKMFFEKNQTISVIIFLYLMCSFVESQHSHRCVLNPYYNPVCGTDRRTYGNKDILACINRQRPHSRHIHEIYHRECDPLICPSVHDIQGPWAATAPVCASNGYTYGHVHQLRCLREHRPGIRVLHEGGCTIHETYRVLGRNAREKACAEPRRNFEINPVCVTNNKTFLNPFEAICFGKRALHERIGGVCESPTQRSCQLAHRLQQSLRSAPASEQTKFLVCGSDFRTYRSKHHLECSRRYNSNLYLMKHERCEIPKNVCPDKLKHVHVASPVCGSDNYSYISFEALLCARYRMNKNLNYLHSGACIRP